MRIIKIIFTFLLIILFSGISYSQITLTLPNVNGASGTNVVSPINVSDLTGLKINTYQFELKYDPNIIVINGLNIAGSITNGTPTFSVDTVKGKVFIAWASAYYLTGNGTLLNINIQFKNMGSTSIKYIVSDSLKPTYTFKSMFGSNKTVIPINGSATTNSGNTPPSLNMNPTGPYTVGEGSTLTAKLVGSDPDAGDVLIYSYTSTPTITGAKINSTTGVFSWTPVTNQFGVYNVIFSVSDGKAKTSDTTNIIVTQTNLPPALNITPTGPFAVNVGTELKVTLVGSDPNRGDVLTYSYSALPIITSGVTFGQSTGIFDWAPTSNQAGIYNVTFSVTDGKDITTITTSITVNNVNLPPTLSLVPVGPYSIDEGQKLSITLEGSDPNAGDVLAFSITNPATLPDGAQLIGNQFSWIPKYNQGSSIPYNFIFKVSDQGGLSASVSIQIIVNNINRAPIFTKELPDNVIVQVNNSPTPIYYTFQYLAADPDSDKVIYSLISEPEGSSITSAGLFSWAPAIAQAGKSYTLTVQASDGTLSAQSTHIISASSTIVGIQEVSEIPTKFALNQNFPNPFNPTTFISFAVPTESFIKISIFNLLGQEIKMLVNKTFSPGNYRINYDASKMNSGIYLYRLEANNFVSSKKMIVLK